MNNDIIPIRVSKNEFEAYKIDNSEPIRIYSDYKTIKIGTDEETKTTRYNRNLSIIINGISIAKLRYLASVSDSKNGAALIYKNGAIIVNVNDNDIYTVISQEKDGVKCVYNGNIVSLSYAEVEDLLKHGLINNLWVYKDKVVIDNNVDNQENIDIKLPSNIKFAISEIENNDIVVLIDSDYIINSIADETVETAEAVETVDNADVEPVEIIENNDAETVETAETVEIIENNDTETVETAETVEIIENNDTETVDKDSESVIDESDAGIVNVGNDDTKDNTSEKIVDTVETKKTKNDILGETIKNFDSCIENIFDNIYDTPINYFEFYMLLINNSKIGNILSIPDSILKGFKSKLVYSFGSSEGGKRAYRVYEMTFGDRLYVGVADYREGNECHNFQIISTPDDRGMTAIEAEHKYLKWRNIQRYM